MQKIIELAQNKRWSHANDLSDATSSPQPISQHINFRCIRGSTICEKNQKIFRKFEKDLYSKYNPIFARLLSNCNIFGHSFIISKNDRLFAPTEYLCHDADKRIKLSTQGKEIQLNDKTTWIIASNATPKNYWHFLAQILPAILHSFEFGKSLGIGNIGLLTHELSSWQKYLIDKLCINFSEIIEIKSNQFAKAKNVIYSEHLSAKSPYAATESRRKIREIILKDKNNKPTKKICISREDTPKRKILNSNELHQELSSKGFEIIIPGNFTAEEQIELFNSSEIIVAPHGAGSANYIFTQADCKILELSQTSYANSGPASLCKISGNEIWFDVFDDDGLGAVTLGWEVDIDSIKRTISWME